MGRARRALAPGLFGRPVLPAYSHHWLWGWLSRQRGRPRPAVGEERSSLAPGWLLFLLFDNAQPTNERTDFRFYWLMIITWLLRSLAAPSGGARRAARPRARCLTIMTTRLPRAARPCKQSARGRFWRDQPQQWWNHIGCCTVGASWLLHHASWSWSWCYHRQWQDYNL